jgi:autotransporter-associated beta strand protein
MRLNHRAIAPLPLLLFLTCASSAQAGTYTWTGAGANNNWSNNQNWQLGIAPNLADDSLDTLVFPTGAQQITMNNNFPQDARIAALVFQAAYVVNGNRIVLTEGITVNIPLVGGADINTALALDGGGEPITVTVRTNQTLQLSGQIGGPSGLTKAGGGTLYLDGILENTFSGVATVAGGTLRMNKTLAVPGGLVVDAGTARYGQIHAIHGAVRVNANGTLDLNGFDDTITALNGDGAVQLGTGSLRIMHIVQPSDFRGVISGPGVLHKDGTASFNLANENTFTGGMFINGGSFTMGAGSALASNVTLNAGSLYGDGPLGALIAMAGRIDPGFGGEGPGTLDPKGLTLNAGAEAEFDLYSAPGGGPGNDQIRVTGAVNLGGATLQLITHETFVPFNGKITLIDNDGNDPVIGTFAGLPQGTIFAGGDHIFHISYMGGTGDGTGNDVVLTSLVTEYHLSEGATGAFFDTDLIVANPGIGAAPFEVRLMKPDGSVDTHNYQLAARSRMTIRVDEIPGFENSEVSIVVKSTLFVPLIVERTMRWDNSGYGAHTEKAVGGPSTNWFFAEGSQGFFSTYLLLANPNNTTNNATVEFLRENNTPVVRTYPLGPNARFTVDAGADPDLVNQSFGMTVRFELAAVAERAMYFGADPVWKAGHESAGVSSPSATWFLAEGATGGYFETFVLMANPNDAAAEVTVTFLPDTGVPIVKQKTIPARSRLTMNIETEDPALANAAVATSFTSTLPIVVERAQYWPDPAPAWHEAHNSFGVTEAAASWGLAEGRVGGPEGYQTYILIANPTDTPNDVTLWFLREGGKPSISKTFTVPPTSRFNVTTGPGSMVPELQDERFGVRLDSFLITSPIVVERAMYSNAGGVVWSAGTNATATRLPITW